MYILLFLYDFYAYKTIFPANFPLLSHLLCLGVLAIGESYFKRQFGEVRCIILGGMNNFLQHFGNPLIEAFAGCRRPCGYFRMHCRG
jgi:hypothetical protein